uniref:Polyprotein protein n=1 Tax=Solanum tuberosum TaxID=4113 RepID=M1D8E7_SOLTU
MPYVLLVFATFGETPKFTKSTWRLAKSLLVRHLSTPLNPCCTVTFGEQTLARRKACERRQWEASEVTSLKAEVADLRKDVDYLKSTYFTSLIQATYDVDAPETSDIPPSNAHKDEPTIEELDAETDEEKIGA